MAGTDFSHLTTDELIKGIKSLDLPDYIRSKAYGVDVRETLAQMTEMLMQLAYNQGMNPQEAQNFVYRINNKINKGEVSMSDLTQEVKEALTGGAVAVVGKDAVGTENIKDNAVKVSKTSYIKTIGKNLFNKNAIKTESSGNVSSELLNIEANTEYYTNLPAKFNVYNQEGVLTSAGLDSLKIGETFTNPYFKIIFDPQYLDEMMLVKIPYVPNRTEYPEIEYEPYVGGEEVYAFDKKINMLLSDVEGVELYKGLNLFNKATVKTESSGNVSSELLNIEANTTYYTNLPAKFNIYNQEGTLVTAGLDKLNISATFTNPYFKIIFEPQYLDDMMLVKTSYPATGVVIPPDYEPYTGGEEAYGFDKKINIALSDVNGVKYYKGLNLFNKATVKTETSGNLSSEFLELEANTTYYTNLPAKFNIYNQEGVLTTAGLDELNIADTFTNPYFKIVFEPQYLDSMMLVKIPYVPNRTEYPEIEFEPYTGGEGVYTLDKKLLADIENNNASDTVANNEPYELYLPDFSGTDEPWHPSVIYIKEGFAGYKYWLTQSVYPNKPDLNEQKDRYEVPIVYKSNDGINWIVVANPLDDLTESEITNKSYMSDPHIVYNHDLKQLEVWYRLSHVVGSTLPTTIFRKVTKDGETWTEREVTVPETLHTASDFARSPSFIYDNGIYRMWKTNNTGIFYQQSTDGKNWTTQTPVVAPGASDGTVRSRWHIDVAKYQADGGQYQLVIYDMDTGSVKRYTGQDGITFTFKGIVIRSVSGQSDLHNDTLYKSASMLDELGNVRLYFSGTGTRHPFDNGKYKANVGVYIAPSWNELLNLDADDYEKLRQSLNDLQLKALGMEITKAQYTVDDHSRI